MAVNEFEQQTSHRFGRDSFGTRSHNLTQSPIAVALWYSRTPRANPRMNGPQISLPEGPLQKPLRSSLPGAASTAMFRASGDSGVEMPHMTSPAYDKPETCHCTKMTSPKLVAG